jgi:hypothetical protein
MKVPSKLALKALIFALITLSAHSEEKRIYQTDSLGNIQYNKPSFTFKKNGRIIETDAVGNKQQYQIKGDKTYPVDSLGNIQYHKPQFKSK